MSIATPTEQTLRRDGFLLGKGQFSVYLYEGLAYKVVKVHSKYDYESQHAREIQTMRLLSASPNCHPNIVCLMDVYFIRSEYGTVKEISHEYPRQGGVDVVLVMERIEGMTLNKLIYRNPGSRQELAHLMLQIIDVIAYLHSRDIYHRDIKPDNIMVTTDHTVKLIDFGHAIHWPKKRKSDGKGGYYGGKALLQDSVGTPYYMLPEIVAGMTYHGKEADAWSMAVTFIDMIHGYGTAEPGIDLINVDENESDQSSDHDSESHDKMDTDIADNLVDEPDELGHIGSKELYINNGSMPLADFLGAVVPQKYRRQPHEEWEAIYSMISSMLAPKRRARLVDLTVIRKIVADWGARSF